MDYKVDLNYKSQDFRNKNGIGLKSPILFKSLLNKLEILTVFKPLDDNISGMVGKIDAFKFMLINSNHSIGRQNFTIAHEMYHFFYDEHFEETIVDYKDSNSMNERKANAFASFLILPDGFIDLIPDTEKKIDRITTSTLVKIEQFYQCSRSALLIRLKNLKLISEDFFKSYNSNVINQALLLGYEIDIYQKGNENKVIGDYTAKAKALFDNEIISESNFIDYLLDININTEDLDIVEK